MQKVKRNGQIAVLVSPGFGAGWVSWNDGQKGETLACDADIVEAVLAKDRTLAASIAKQKFPGEHVCVLGAEDLVVEWVDEGSNFEINEYDGSESLHVIGEGSYLTA